tara:strand:- start:208923 stop:209891 length:969 start_codon:yes stop_codon:yes gene_type:complete
VLINGKWTQDWQPVQSKDEQGRFVRFESAFRNWVTPDGRPGPTGSGGFKAEAGRYRLYVALICPWASRTLIARQFKGLSEIIPVTVLNPVLTDQGWCFGGDPDADEDPLFAARYMHVLYTRADPGFSGRATVPVLWDTWQNTIVSNESADILRMFNSAFSEIVPNDLNLYPDDLAAEIDALAPRMYDQLNNGVYKAGFASTQQAYDEAVRGVFAMLDDLEGRLTGDFVLGSRLTELDIRLFVTLIRFDAAYHGIFKTNLRQIADYPRLSRFLERFLNLPGVRDTVNMRHIVAGYYSIKALNPSGINPVGPDHITRLLENAKS